jgi:hypothetical protein
MKPGEFIGSDGRAHNVRSVMLDELDDACNSATMQLNGGAWLTYKKHLLPSHPDFATAVAALQSLIRPSLDAEQCSNCQFWRYLSDDKDRGKDARFVEGWCRRHPPAPAFPGSLPDDWCGEYERERG